MDTFEKIEIFIESSGEKKRHEWMSSRKFFSTPKNVDCLESLTPKMVED